MDNIDNVKKELAKILSQIVKNQIYGSVEIYFEGGHITQITQRIINKISHHHKPASKKISIGVKFSTKPKVISKSVSSEKNSNTDPDLSPTNSY